MISLISRTRTVENSRKLVSFNCRRARPKSNVQEVAQNRKKNGLECHCNELHSTQQNVYECTLRANIFQIVNKTARYSEAQRIIKIAPSVDVSGGGGGKYRMCLYTLRMLNMIIMDVDAISVAMCAGPGALTLTHEVLFTWCWGVRSCYLHFLN